MATEISPSTFRVSKEVKERFKSVAKSEGWNQDEALNKLIGIYEIEQAKITIGERKTEIETFETHLQALSEVYRMSLQLNQDAEERIKLGYTATLESNQKTIQDLQNRIADLETDLEVADSYKEKNTQLEHDIARTYTEMQKTNDLCAEYKDKNDTLNGLLVSYREDHEENITLHKELQDMDKLRADMATLKQQAETNQKLQEDKSLAEIANLKQQQESALKMCQLELKEKHQEKIDLLKNKHHEELEQSTANYRTVLQELDQLRQENYSLKEQLLNSAPKKASAPRKTTKKVEDKEESKKE